MTHFSFKVSYVVLETYDHNTLTHSLTDLSWNTLIWCCCCFERKNKHEIYIAQLCHSDTQFKLCRPSLMNHSKTKKGKCATKKFNCLQAPKSCNYCGMQLWKYRWNYAIVPSGYRIIIEKKLIINIYERHAVRTKTAVGLLWAMDT